MSSPETTLALSYLARARKLGHGLGFGSFTLSEFDERKPKKAMDGVSASLLVALDERGKSITSEAFATQLADWRDMGEARASFVIGGPDGLPAEVKRAARLSLAFGIQTWPHLLVRAMLAEQIYRAITILARHPYHRP